MAPEDPRHGTYAGYVAESFARIGHRAYKKQRRTRLYFAGGVLTVDPTGTRRRIEALVALGWTFNELDRRLGRSTGFTSRQRVHAAAGRPVFQSTAQAYTRLYDELSMRVPPADFFVRRSRTRALRLGWVVPLAWDDDTIDNPAARPHGLPGLKVNEDRTRHHDQVDEAVVLRVLAGEHLPTTRDEREEILTRHLAAGGIERELCARLGWREGRYGRTNRAETAA
jgi:hypothetical protein